MSRSNLDDNESQFDTWANFPDATLNENRIIAETGIYRSPVYFVSNGERWVPVNGEATIANLQVPVGIACTFTGTTNGAITFGSALNNLIPECYVYYPANSLSASHAAGFFWTKFSSTTAAVVYNNQFTPAAGNEPTRPTTEVPFSGAVPGGTGVSGTEITTYTFAIPAALLGDYGGIESAVQSEFYNFAGGNKSTRIKLSSTNVGVQTLTTSPVLNGLHRFKNIGTPSVQRGSVLVSGSSNTIYYAAIDTSVDTTVSVTMQTSNAAEWAFLFYYVAKVVV